MDSARILEVEPKWIERGVMEAIHIRMVRPSINSGVCWFNLWTNTLKFQVQSGGGGDQVTLHVTMTSHPRTAIRDQVTD